MELTIVGALVAAGIAAVAFVLWRWAAPSVCGSKIPTPFSYFSDMLMCIAFSGRFPDILELHTKHGPLFWWRFLGQRQVLVGTIEAVKRLLNGEGTLVKADYPTSVHKLLGPWGTVNVVGKQHTRIKRLAQAAFTLKAIRGYLPRMQAIADQAVQKWAADGDIMVHQEMKWFTLRIAVETIVGLEDGWTSPEQFPIISAEFEVWLKGLFSIPLAIPGTAFSRGMKMRELLLRRIHASMDLLEESKAAAAATAGTVEGNAGAGEGDKIVASEGDEGATPSQTAALELLVNSKDEDGNGLTRDQISDTILTMLFAGHDTRSSSLTRAFHHLHCHPEAVKRLRQEQADVAAKHGTTITEAALQDMPYAEGVVRETLRITPIVNAVLRTALQDLDLCGYTVPAGTSLQVSLTQPLLTDARWQGEENRMAFKPERWLGGATQKQGAWIPFGGGPRMCLGWLLAMTEMKVLLAVIFRGYALELCEPDEPWVLFPIARPKHGMKARFVAVQTAQ